MTLTAAMEEDHFLVEAASYAQYYDNVKECIRAVQDCGLADSPSQEIIDNPRLFNNWLEQCKMLYRKERF